MNFRLKTAVVSAISAGLVAGALIASAATQVTAYQCADGSLVTDANACSNTTVSNPTCYQFTRNLSLGSTGADVMQLQETLNNTGFTVATQGAGSPGHESSYFGVLTKSAVARWQTANATAVLAPWGLTEGTGYFGKTSIDYLNTHCGNSNNNGNGNNNNGNGNNNGGTVTNGTVSVSLSGSQPNNVLVAGSARNNMLNLSFNGTGVVTNITLQRTGISNNSAVSSVYLVDNATQQVIGGITASVNNNGVVSFNNPAGLFVVNGSASISVVADLVSTVNGQSISGQSIGFALTGYAMAGGAQASVTGLNGPNLPVGSAQLATVQINSTPTSAGTNINAGNPNVTLWSAPISVSTNNVSFSGITFTAIGSIPQNAFTNYKLYVDGQQVGNAVSMDNNMRVSFSFAPVALNTGSHTIELRADNQAGSGRSVQFSINAAGDAIFKDSNIGANVSLTSLVGGCSTYWNLTCAQAAQVTIGNGALSVTTDSTWNPSTIISGASNQTIAKYVVNTYGEDEKVYSFTVTPTLTSAMANGTTTNVINNLSLYVNGAQVGSTINQANSAQAYTFNQTYVFPAGSVNSIEVRADMNSTLNGGTYPITSGSVTAAISGTAYGNGINGANASGNSTNFTGTSNNVSAGASDGSIGVYGATSKTISPNTNQQNLGSFIFQNGNNGSVTLNQISIAANISGAATTDFRNVSLQMNGANVGTPYAYAAGSMNWNPSLTVGPNQSVTFDLIGDVGSVANNSTFTATASVQYTGQTSNVVSNKTAGSAVVSTINQATLNAPTLAGNTPVSQFIVGGNTTQVADFNLSVAQGNTTVNEIKFKVGYDSNAANGQPAVNTITVAGQSASVINGVADVTGLNIPLSTSNYDLPVSVSTTCFGGSGNCNQTSLNNNAVYVAITDVMSNQSGVTDWSGSSATTTAPAYIVASKPTIAQANGYTGSSHLTGGNQILAAYTVSADQAGAINLEQLAFTSSLSTSGSATVSNLYLCTNTSCSSNVANATSSTSTLSAGTTNYTFNLKANSANGYSIGAGSSVTFYVIGNVTGSLGSAGDTSISTQLGSASNFKWNEAIGSGPATRDGSGIVNYPISSYYLSN